MRAVYSPTTKATHPSTSREHTHTHTHDALLLLLLHVHHAHPERENHTLHIVSHVVQTTRAANRLAAGSHSVTMSTVLNPQYVPRGAPWERETEETVRGHLGRDLTTVNLGVIVAAYDQHALWNHFDGSSSERPFVRAMARLFALRQRMPPIGDNTSMLDDLGSALSPLLAEFSIDELARFANRLTNRELSSVRTHVSVYASLRRQLDATDAEIERRVGLIGADANALAASGLFDYPDRNNDSAGVPVARPLHRDDPPSIAPTYATSHAIEAARRQ